jgi:hypothetical protein
MNRLTCWATNHHRRERRWQGIGAFCLVFVLLLTLLSGCGNSSTSSGASHSSSSGVTVGTKVVHGSHGATLVLLPVTIDGQGPYTFALDTGATISLIDKPLARHLNLQQVGRAGSIAGVASDERAYPVKVTRWRIGSLNLPAATIASANLFGSQRSSGLQGLVGSDIWRQFGTLTINYSAQQLTVPKQIASSSR